MLGPSHHVHFKDQVWLSRYVAYATPLGLVHVDVDENKNLAGGPVQFMDEEADQDEHSFEMHLPFLVAKCMLEGVAVPKIVPVMVSPSPVQDAGSQPSGILRDDWSPIGQSHGLYKVKMNSYQSAQLRICGGTGARRQLSSAFHCYYFLRQGE